MNVRPDRMAKKKNAAVMEFVGFQYPRENGRLQLRGHKMATNVFEAVEEPPVPNTDVALQT